MSGKYTFTKALKEVRFHLCQTSEHSAATRSFLTRAYPTMKKNNPHTPIMIREALGVEPKVFARYGMIQAVPMERISGFLRWLIVAVNRVWEREKRRVNGLVF
ncbi:MAG: hypothetical protein Q9169_002068 [Polycauliona sp. 2 TL-2023]